MWHESPRRQAGPTPGPASLTTNRARKVLFQRPLCCAGSQPPRALLQTALMPLLQTLQGSLVIHLPPHGPPFTPSAQKLYCPLAPDSEAHWPLVSQMPTSDLGFRGHPKHPRRLGWRVCSNDPKFCVIQQPQEAQAPQNREGPEVGQRLRRWRTVGHLRTAGRVSRSFLLRLSPSPSLRGCGTFTDCV